MSTNQKGEHILIPNVKMVESDDDQCDTRFLVIEEGKVNSISDFHNEISRLLRLADWYGRNLDAFNDALRGGCGEVDPIDKIFVWKGHQKAKLALGENYFDEIIEIFRDGETNLRLE